MADTRSPAPFPKRMITLLFQQVEENALLLANRHASYMKILARINHWWDSLQVSPEDQPARLKSGLFYDGNDEEISPDRIGPHTIISVPGSHAYCYDVTADYATDYTRKIQAGWSELLSSHTSDKIDVLASYYDRIMRSVVRGKKYQLYQDPDYFHPHVMPFVFDFLLPRVFATPVKDDYGEMIIAKQPIAKVEEGLRLNFVTYSYGGLFLRQAFSLLAILMEIGGYTAGEIQQGFDQVFSLQVGPNYQPTVDADVLPQINQIFLVSPNDRVVIPGAGWHQERIKFKQGERAIQLDQEGRAWLVWADNMPKRYAYDEEHLPVFTYKGHKLKGSNSYFLAMTTQEYPQRALDAVLLAASTGQIPDLVSIFEAPAQSQNKSFAVG